jgi:uncharacterized protein (TIGR03435 family)
MGDMNTSKEIRKYSILAAALLSFGSSIVLGQGAPAKSTSAPPAVSNSAPAFEPQFDVASVRQNLTPEPRWRMSFTDDGVSAQDVTLFYAIEEAYGLYDEQLWAGIPPWIKEKRFDIEARYDVEKYPKITFEQRKAMLQQFLAERFKLAAHHEQKEFPLYALAIAKGGPKFEETKPEDLHIGSYGPRCDVLRSKMGLTEMKGCSMEQLAHHLTGWTRNDLGRTIVDHTGLTGRYNFSLKWTQDTPSPSSTLDTGGGPSIFTALQEQLGLQLRPEKGPLDTIVIDHVEMPTEN